MVPGVGGGGKWGCVSQCTPQRGKHFVKNMKLEAQLNRETDYGNAEKKPREKKQ